MENGGEMSRRNKMSREQSIVSIGADERYLDNNKKTGRGVQHAEGLHENYKEYPLCRV